MLSNLDNEICFLSRRPLRSLVSGHMAQDSGLGIFIPTIYRVFFLPFLEQVLKDCQRFILDLVFLREVVPVFG